MTVSENFLAGIDGKMYAISDPLWVQRHLHHDYLTKAQVLSIYTSAEEPSFNFPSVFHSIVIFFLLFYFYQLDSLCLMLLNVLFQLC